MPLAPIALFVYNRPWHTRNTIEALKKNELSAKSELFIYSDGPKYNVESQKAVAEVRNYLKEVRGFKKITIASNAKNMGLANSVIKGVSEVVQEYNKVIVLEDDLVTAPDFLIYMNQALEKYEKEKQVMQVSGFMFDVDIESETDAIFLPSTTSWGWATWKRAWDHFDPLMTNYKKLEDNKELRFKFNREGSHDFFNMLKSQLHGEIDSWAIRWYLSVFMLQGLILYPVKSLVKNIGFDGTGTHCRKSINEQNFDRSWPTFNEGIKFPEVEIHTQSYIKIVNYFFSKKSMLQKIKRFLFKLKLWTS